MFNLFLVGCISLEQGFPTSEAGMSEVTIALPFSAGTKAKCIGNDRSSIDLSFYPEASPAIFAPQSGTVQSVKEDALGLAFGESDTIGLAGIATPLVEAGEYVAQGQLIAFGKEVIRVTAPNTVFDTQDMSMKDSPREGTPVSKMLCDFAVGHDYQSFLPTATWHPSGSVIHSKETEVPFVVNGESVQQFADDQAFAARNLSASDIVPTTAAELNCFERGSNLGPSTTFAVFGEGKETDIWLLTVEGNVTTKLHVPAFGWQGVLASWGITALTLDDLGRVDQSALDGIPNNGVATYRDGALVAPAELDDIFFMSGGVAMPFDSDDTRFFAGFKAHSVLTIDGEEFDAIIDGRGDCTMGDSCLAKSNFITCN